MLTVGRVQRSNPAIETIKRAIKGGANPSIAITRVGPFRGACPMSEWLSISLSTISTYPLAHGSEIVEIQPQTVQRVAEREDIALL